eukprot:Opistho-2@3147
MVSKTSLSPNKEGGSGTSPREDRSYKGDPNLTFAPKLNDNSMSLVRARRNTLPAGLTSPEKKAPYYDRELTFVPKINEHSAEMASKRTSNMSLLERLNRRASMTQAELYAARSALDVARRKKEEETSTSPTKSKEAEQQQPKQGESTRPIPVPIRLTNRSPPQRHKAFLICGPYADENVRSTLLSRGWVEKRRATDQLDLLWTLRPSDVDHKTLSKDHVMNHFRGSSEVTTKLGLCRNLKSLPWFDSTDPDTFYPRCHSLDNEEGREDFIEDFRTTAALCILRHHSELHVRGISVAVLKLALQAVNFWIRRRVHDDIDIDDSSALAMTEETLRVLVSHSYALTKQPQHKLLKNGAALTAAVKDRRPSAEDASTASTSDATKSDSSKSGEARTDAKAEVPKVEPVATEQHPGELNMDIECALRTARDMIPQYDLSGSRNVWIVKPGAKSRGRGIQCMNDMDEILRLADSDERKEERWVAQKYIENPLVIHGKKFDIRQWVLVTEWNPLTIWFYKDCYLRFSTDSFTLDDLDNKTIHLTNNSIQKCFDNFGTIDFAVGNMWSSDQFKEYLTETKRGSVYDEIVYPQMKQVAIWALQSAQDLIETRKNSFELYGVDFILDDQFRPWLVEVNSSPCLAASTPVTETLCAQVVEDTMKVIVDRRENPGADIGRWELALRQSFIPIPASAFSGCTIGVEGCSVSKLQSAAPTAAPDAYRGAAAPDVGDGGSDRVSPLQGADQPAAAGSAPTHSFRACPGSADGPAFERTQLSVIGRVPKQLAKGGGSAASSNSEDGGTTRFPSIANIEKGGKIKVKMQGVGGANSGSGSGSGPGGAGGAAGQRAGGEHGLGYHEAVCA